MQQHLIPINRLAVGFFCTFALLTTLAPCSFAQYGSDHITGTLISPDCKSFACYFKATACKDALDPPSAKVEHQVIASFDLEKRKWKILDQIERKNLSNSDRSSQYLRLIAFSPDGKYLAISNTRTEFNLLQRLMNSPFDIPSVHATTSFWDTQQQKLVSTLDNVETPGCMSSTGWIISMPKFEIPNAFTLAHDEQEIELWNFLSRKRELSFAHAIFDLSKGGDQFSPGQYSFSPDSKFLAVNITHLGGVGVAVPPHSLVDSHMVRIYDTHSGNVIKTLPMLGRVQAFSQDGKTLLSCGKELTAWDVSSGKQIWKKQLNATGSSGRESICSAGNRVLAYFEPYQRVKMKDGKEAELHNGLHFTQVFDLSTGKMVRDLGSESDYTKEVMLTPDGKKVVTFNGKGSAPKVKFFDIDSGKLVSELDCNIDEIEAILQRL
jgi:WD40 repeat protein